ncbi:nucleotidyltransferase family protein [Falsibacillus albus]|uniref:Nucleotidyltransferase family protein n=1 Tax=Falsibacillus albus TaxID=2478915 RepID=A0A3L7K1K1_9BACI|nr:nucleotidyltransferase family protein [Falsibacillus albus]RLQ96269.1 hypothetical protein D9X91_08260 [Falsibacillus albus]
MDLIRQIYNPNGKIKMQMNDYHLALHEIEFFQIYPQILFKLKEMGEFESTPSFFQDRLKKRSDEVLYNNLLIKQQVGQICAVFERQEIEAIPLKGINFAERYFGSFAARSTSDIDILIRKEQLAEAVVCVESLGFNKDEPSIAGHFHTTFMKQIPGSKIPLRIELHWNIIKEKTASIPIQQFWNEAACMGEFAYIKELSTYHTFYLMCLHGWRHNMDSLRHFLDIIQIITTYPTEIDFDRLIRDTIEHKTKKRVFRTLSLVYQEFPFLNEIKELPFKMQYVHWAYRFIKEEKESNIKKYINFIDYQFLSFDTSKHMIYELLSWIRPAARK